MIASRSVWEPQPDRVAVFRALNLGDLLCTVPAFRALRRALPEAHITLIGLPSATPIVERFRKYLDELVIFPGDPAFPEQAVRTDELPDFYQAMAARRFDVALQMHGSGTQSNKTVQSLGAGKWAGFVPSIRLQEHGRLMVWPDRVQEIRRYLSLLAYLGLPYETESLEFPVTPQDNEDARSILHQSGLDPSKTIVVHPGARLASRRWPLQRFAAVASALLHEGWQIAITGSSTERALAQDLARLCPPAIDLSGCTSLGSLACIVRDARLVICNDTGISHVAAAVQARSVVIASGSDVARWAPLNKTLHKVLHADVPCRPCSYEKCPIGHDCAMKISTEQVVRAAHAHLSQAGSR